MPYALLKIKPVLVLMPAAFALMLKQFILMLSMLREMASALVLIP